MWEKTEILNIATNAYEGIRARIGRTRNLILRATGESLKPRWLWFGVTNRCNSRCKHCNIWRQEATRDPLTPKEIETALGDPLFRGVEYILNSGGEAVLRDDLEEIILIEHKVLPKAGLQISTNGLLPQRVIDVVKTAIKHDINIDVGISLDGIGREHDSIRGVRGNFKKVDWLLHELSVLREKHEDRLGFAVGTVLSDLTLPSLEKIRTYLQKFNVEPILQWYNEAPFYSNIGKRYATKVSNLVETVQTLPYSPLREMWLRFLMGKPIKFSCFAMYTFCVLKCNGDIVPCLSLFGIKAGNVRESSPTTIWHSSEANKARRFVKDCQGCLNDWGINWSFASAAYQFLPFDFKHPATLVEKLMGK